jgi:carbamoyl-phosphate synthase (ammonia)
LKEEGVEVILMNPNIASVQTNVDPNQSAEQRKQDKGAADRVFFLPVTPDYVEAVLEKEKPDAILISMGGQTALNCGIELDHAGILAKHGCRVLGTSIETVIATEDRQIFKDKCAEIDEPCANSFATASVAEALEAGDKVGYPLMARAAFALGGLGSGICANADELRTLATKALAVSPQLLIEKSMLGWKEVEYEVVRDQLDNCITVCNMENFDPLGVHTGDSIVIAPSQTLSNEEYHMLRSAALRVVRHLGIVGECNIQYALHPESLEYCIIEVNPRLSRSSALASKATGYPLAFVAAKLSMGVTLPELRNTVTGGATIMGFEPALDYCVTKIPRFDLGKFQGANRVLGSAMASVGEVMAIGRTFEESFQKALRMVDPSHPGFEPIDGVASSESDLEAKIKVPTDRRVWGIAEALYKQQGWDKHRVRDLSQIDDWFLSRLENIAAVGRDTEKWACLGTLIKKGDPAATQLLREAKQLGFADEQIAKLCGSLSDDDVRACRKALGVIPRVKQIDTLAAEYAAETNYLYTTYHGDDDDSTGVDTGGTLVLGSGPYRIGSSVEFDWCGVSAMRALRGSGTRGVMINCNPETVSTDYDECDALYFEELSKERVMDVYDKENIDTGCVISMGGQIPQMLAGPMHAAGATILGTHPDMIDAAEDRSKFSALMDAAGVDQPKWAELASHQQAVDFASDVGYPVLVRPSFVLSGAAMKVCTDEEDLRSHLDIAKEVSQDYPVVVSQFVRGARELEMDGVAKDGVVVCCQAHEHVEDAGVHSGDATLLLPPQSLSDYVLRKAREDVREIVKQLQISGPFNIQFLIGGRTSGSKEADELDGSFASMNDVRVIECNLRASRSVPFVSKATGVDFADVATRVLAGLPLPSADKLPQLFPREGQAPQNFVAVKAPMFSFSRLRGADPALGVEMSSTGEVACFGRDKEEAFLKALLSTTMKVPTAGAGDTILVSFAKPLAHRALGPAFQLHDLGYDLVGTAGTAEYLNARGVPCAVAAFPTETSDGDATATQLLRDKKIKLAVNLHAPESERLEDNFMIRRTASDFGIALVTNPQVFELLAAALTKTKKGDILAANPSDLFSYYEREPSTEAWTGADEFH